MCRFSLSLKISAASIIAISVITVVLTPTLPLLLFHCQFAIICATPSFSLLSFTYIPIYIPVMLTLYPYLHYLCCHNLCNSTQRSPLISPFLTCCRSFYIFFYPCNYLRFPKNPLTLPPPPPFHHHCIHHLYTISTTIFHTELSWTLITCFNTMIYIPRFNLPHTSHILIYFIFNSFG